MLSEAFLGLGSNLGDRVANLEAGVRLLEEQAGEVEVSSMYATTAVGFTTQPAFYNAVCRLWTRLTVFELMHEIRVIERAVNRQPTFVNAPRTLDVDILLYGNRGLCTPPVTVPHPRMAERRFVLQPLVELAPNPIHPTLGVTMRELLNRLPAEPTQVVAQARAWGRTASP
ncbi:MAG: 2-amino-4-hydroxy-6-hydroxymethyldihydropteridine diphosphokinase [SAR202 cluster bacterium]|nr:2-amino-4-hydroxy-6-hydroxymethyldihydropteridine diphosphokinase [SAR202 cluster bacterium]MDP7226854.1 2-amino-4-hydroxy-6-hydroxymethyldihydropteridine diphosphokinase [SAR202 cluster bacterium]MDP7415207.1 2-amino-4-hydroxy-6-hydroxymethyldihydropteridine diphosphokinase [SAR202 cluster bacterium]MDP7534965.1 2-amino-4-hydroxy-6-hydroxymethyldihydropteridine diphosphokinase [SAR202 cluster bacterium]